MIIKMPTHCGDDTCSSCVVAGDYIFLAHHGGVCGPAQQWLDGEIDNGTIIRVIQEADKQCGSCGCEIDPLYKRALELL